VKFAAKDTVDPGAFIVIGEVKVFPAELMTPAPVMVMVPKILSVIVGDKIRLPAMLKEEDPLSVPVKPVKFKDLQVVETLVLMVTVPEAALM
jgi:hypothetical protein